MTLLAQKIDPFGQVHLALGWAPSLLVLRAGTRGGCWIFCRKKMSERSELFFQKKSNSHPASPPAQPEVWEPKPSPPPQPEARETKLYVNVNLNYPEQK